MAIEALAVAPGAEQDESALLDRLRAEITGLNGRLRNGGLTRSTKSVARTAEQVEELANTISQTQLILARIIKAQNIAAVGETDTPHDPDEPNRRRHGAYKTNEDYLRAKLGIARQEAARRFQLAEATEAKPAPEGTPVPPPRLPVLASALDEGMVSGQAASLIRKAIDGLRSTADPEQLCKMEEALVKHASDYDVDSLRLLIRQWEGGLNPGGADPRPADLKSRQGLFYRGRRNGLHCYEINATDEQNEVLATVYNTATNPRLREGTATAGTVGYDVADAVNVADTRNRVDNTQAAPAAEGSDPTGGPTDTCGTVDQGHGHDTGPDASADSVPTDGRTRQQKQLDGLVGACKVALTTDLLPAAGGRRPQLLATIDYKDLASDLGRPGASTFSGPISAKTIRRMACDADIIPVVLAGMGVILDVGQSQRLFPRYMRLAIIARDGGCAFPGCTAPSPWTEVHHIQWFERGGPTSTDNGVLLCSHHHHLIHEGDWRIEVIDGVAWFFPPPDMDPERKPLRNHVWLKDAQLPERLSEPALLSIHSGQSAHPPVGDLGGPDVGARGASVEHTDPPELAVEAELDIGLESAAEADRPAGRSSPFRGWPGQPAAPPF
ncbi:DUF222 domain-containing protein [Arthrobacter sp. CAU 1506]|uniref:HNH endonuclease signature motif containing protein n=1 Tax=Arthrobacter sp. CAU 1506 TaxID=2560052 RepID=UPI0010ACE2E8|nr:HNH endonuclease signature motif containing protein [Arthrobacter sp. CAU 1506]TJY66346.1 DUF222 domain-containing protein [Arthrobacter sp. CAU 1506]